jgi:phosphoribosylglycinamide formyltransferase 1
MKDLRLAVLLSGNGRTLQNLIDRRAAGSLPARVVLVVSNRVDAYGLERAELADIPTLVVRRNACTSVEEFGQRIFGGCRQAQVDLVCLAGFLQFLPIPDDFQNRVLNIHPALIPGFCGKGFYGERVHQAVLDTGVKVTGCTVHFADNEYDHGPIVLQRPVPVHDDDTPETLAERVFAAECQAYPEAIRLFAEGRLRVEGRQVRILPRGPEAGNPG